jgi:SAM-dependent methyltransferase
MDGSRQHWEAIYAQRDPRTVSWYEPTPEVSLELIDGRLARDAAILDLGGGASNLAQALLGAGYTDITVADISSVSIQLAITQLGDHAQRVSWVTADVRSHDFARLYDLWHDRAVLHFMVDPADRDRYLDTLRRTVRAGGNVILATFGPDGPPHCSGLPVSRYDAGELARLLGTDFEPISSRLHEHHTPTGASQQFLYLHARRRPAARR